MTRWSLGRNKFVLQYHAAESAFQLFPTCQVRVVRFYQSCSRLASPPPPASSPPKAQNHGISTTRVDQTPGTRGKSWFPLVHQIAVIPALNSTKLNINLWPDISQLDFLSSLVSLILKMTHLYRRISCKHLHLAIVGPVVPSIHMGQWGYYSNHDTYSHMFAKLVGSLPWNRFIDYVPIVAIEDYWSGQIIIIH